MYVHCTEKIQDQNLTRFLFKIEAPNDSALRAVSTGCL